MSTLPAAAPINSRTGSRLHMTDDKRRENLIARLRDDEPVPSNDFDELVESALQEPGEDVSEVEEDADLPELFRVAELERLERRRKGYSAARRKAKAGSSPRLYE